MVRQLPNPQVFTLHQPDADEVYLACDCLGWFPMQRIDRCNWQLTLQLPRGRFHLRFYVRIGDTLLWHSQEDVDFWPSPSATEPDQRHCLGRTNHDDACYTSGEPPDGAESKAVAKSELRGQNDHHPKPVGGDTMQSDHKVKPLRGETRFPQRA